MTIKQKTEIVKEISLAISGYLKEQTDVGSNLPNDFETKISKVISDLLPDQPSSAEILEQIQNLSGSVSSADELNKVISQKDSEIATLKVNLERQTAAAEHYKAKVKAMEGEKKLHIKALNDAEKAREKALKQLHDQHAKELKRIESKYEADLRKLEEKRVQEAEKYAKDLKEITNKNTEAFAGIKESVQNDLNSVHQMVSLVRKSQKEDGLNPRQIGQMMRVADHSAEQVASRSESNTKAFKEQVDRFAKGVGIAAKTNKLLVEASGSIDGSAKSITKASDDLSTQVTDITHSTTELKKEAAVLNKLPQELKNTIESEYRHEVRSMNNYVSEQNKNQGKMNEQLLKDMESIVGKVNYLIESAKKDVDKEKLAVFNKMTQRLDLIVDTLEKSSRLSERLVGNFRNVSLDDVAKIVSELKAAKSEMADFTSTGQIKVDQLGKNIEGMIDAFNKIMDVEDES